MALCRREPAVQDRHVVETAEEPANGLRRQGDLRDQHDRSTPLLHRPLDHADIHLGLATARDTVQQMHAESFIQFRDNRVVDALLLSIQRDR